MALPRTRRRIWPLALLGLFLLAAAGAWWVAGSETALRWAAESLVRASGGRLQIEAPGGTLLGTLRARRVLYHAEGMRIAVEAAETRLRLSALVRGKMALKTLRAREVSVELAPADAAPQPPESLALPLALVVEDIAVTTLRISQGDAHYMLHDLAGHLTAGGATHRLDIRHLRHEQVTLSARLEVGTLPPFALAGDMTVAGSAAAHAVSARVGLSGSLLALRAELDGKVAAVAFDGSVELMPFEPRWLNQAALAAYGLDLANWVEGAPRTDIKLALTAAGGSTCESGGKLKLENAIAGTPAEDRLPLKSVTAAFEFGKGGLALEGMRVDLGVAGRLSGSGRITGEGSRWTLRTDALNLRGLHIPLRQTRLAGAIVATTAAGRLQLDIDLKEAAVAIRAVAMMENAIVQLRQVRISAGASTLAGEGQLALSDRQPFTLRAQARRLDPAAFGDWPQASVNADISASGSLQPQWSAAVRFRIVDSRYRGAALAGSGELELVPGAMRGLLADLSLGSNRLRARGSLARQESDLAFDINAGNLAQIDPRIAGKLTASASLGGSLAQPRLQFSGRGESLRLDKDYAIATFDAKGEISAASDGRLALRFDARRLAIREMTLASLHAAADGRLTQHSLELKAVAPGLDLMARFEGGWNGEVWNGRVVRLDNRGSYPVTLLAPARMEIARQRVLLGEAALRAADGEFALRTLRWEQGALSTAGSARALAVSPLLAAAGWPLAAESDLKVGGEWSIAMAPRLNGTLRLARESGDLVVAGTPRTALALTRLAIDADAAEDEISITAALVSGLMGEIAGKARLSPAADATPGTLSAQTRLSGTISANMNTLKAANDLIGTAAVLDGRLSAALVLDGTLGAPVVTGTAAAEGMRVDVPAYGVALRDGRARIRLDEETLTIEELRISGPAGRLEASGMIARGDTSARLDWRADGLRIFNRPDRRLVVTGAGKAAFSNNRLALQGTLRADEGYIEFQRRKAGRLGDDVVIVGRQPKPGPAGKARGALPIDLDLVLDAGERLRISGAGLDTGLRGRLKLGTGAGGAITASGTIETVRGTYFAYGQKLTIERGRLHFDGPIDNPLLDVLALRKNQAVEAGVELAGTVQNPRVTLASNPPVPDNEKLSWLVLGRDVQNASAADLALLQAASGALLGSGASPGQQLARGVGLDDIGLRGAAGSTGGQVVALGKQLSERIYLEYEQGLNQAANVVRISFILTRSLSLRAETSQQTSSFGINFQRSFD